jgi:type II secretory pathway pseudopilin PulG
LLCQIPNADLRSASPQGRAIVIDQASPLIELMVATAITAIVVAGTAITWVAATRNSREGGIDVQLDALIEDDVAAIIDQSNRFTCCPGTCTSDASTIAAAAATNPADCSTTTPGSETYYSPTSNRSSRG